MRLNTAPTVNIKKISPADWLIPFGMAVKTPSKLIGVALPSTGFPKIKPLREKCFGIYFSITLCGSLVRT